MTKEIQAYSKTTVGFVTQQYILNKEGNYVCIEQFFTAGDIVERNNDDGDIVQIDTTKEVYQEFDMEQPKTETTFEEWYEENKHNTSVQRHFRGVVDEDPDYPLCFKDWCKKYFYSCIDKQKTTFTGNQNSVSTDYE